MVTSVTYKTHPIPQSFTIGFVQLNTTNNKTFHQVVEKSLQLLPSVTEAGYTGYGSFDGGFSAIFLQPNGTIETFNKTILAPFQELTRLPGVSGQVGASPATWNDYVSMFLSDPHIGTNVQDTSRLLTVDVLRNRAAQLADLILESGDGAGFDFSKLHTYTTHIHIHILYFANSKNERMNE